MSACASPTGRCRRETSWRPPGSPGSWPRSARRTSCRSAIPCRSRWSPSTRPSRRTGVEITATAETTAQTGVEMEALTAAVVAALTVYDMTKGLDPAISICDRRAGREVGRKERALEARARVRAAVLTVSDGVVAGTRVDTSGDVLEAKLIGAGFELAGRRAVADERAEIAAALRDLAGGRRPRPDHGRHGLCPARRHAGGDRRGDRAAHAGPRRAHAVGRRSPSRRTACSRAAAAGSAGRR